MSWCARKGYREWIFLSSAPTHELQGLEWRGGDVQERLRLAVGVSSVPGNWELARQDRSRAGKKDVVEQGFRRDTRPFQTDLMGIAVEVKDIARFPEKWAYFSFDSSTKTAKANPRAMCWQCHHGGGAVENTFVQFYPTLKPLAQQFGTYRQAVEGPDSFREIANPRATYGTL